MAWILKDFFALFLGNVTQNEKCLQISVHTRYHALNGLDISSYESLFCGCPPIFQHKQLIGSYLEIFI